MTCDVCGFKSFGCRRLVSLRATYCGFVCSTITDLELWSRR